MEPTAQEKVEELLDQLELRDVRRRRTIRQRLRVVPDRLLNAAVEETFMLVIFDGSVQGYQLLQLLLDELEDRRVAGGGVSATGEAPEAF